METMKVIILPSGTEAREVNPLGEKVNRPADGYTDDKGATEFWNSYENDWQAAEEKLLTFEIASVKFGNETWVNAFQEHLIPGSIHEAELLPSGKIRIIT